MPSKTKSTFIIQGLLSWILLFMILTACSKDDSKPGKDGTDSIPFNPEITYGRMNDIEDNDYKTITIGSQTWMAENLRTTKYNDGTPIPEVNDNTAWSNLSTGAQCISKSADNAEAIYGRLYNWYAVNTGKLCPQGWHVPTDQDWIILENYLIAHGYNYDPSDTTSNMIAKALAATSFWNEYFVFGSVGSNPADNNRTGFTALPGGVRHPDGGFNGVGEFGGWWTSTLIKPDSANQAGLAFCRQLTYASYGLEISDERLKCGLSVRCVKD